MVSSKRSLPECGNSATFPRNSRGPHDPPGPSHWRRTDLLHGRRIGCPGGVLGHASRLLRNDCADTRFGITTAGPAGVFATHAEVGGSTIAAFAETRRAVRPSLAIQKAAGQQLVERTHTTHQIASGAFSAVWANDGGNKVTRDELRGSTANPNVSNSVWDGEKIRIFGGRNEVLGFNVILEARSQGVPSVAVSLDSLDGPKGAQDQVAAGQRQRRLQLGRPRNRVVLRSLSRDQGTEPGLLRIVRRAAHSAAIPSPLERTRQGQRDLGRSSRSQQALSGNRGTARIGRSVFRRYGNQSKRVGRRLRAENRDCGTLSWIAADSRKRSPHPEYSRRTHRAGFHAPRLAYEQDDDRRGPA